MGISSSLARPEGISVAVLGSARIDDQDPRWKEANALGSSIAARGWTALTGGYGGLMGAVAEGARSAGGHTVGLPMRPWGHLTPHAANAELRWSVNYGERIEHLLTADVAIALPGGIGTLAEAAMVWAAAQTEPDTARLILVGEDWQALTERFSQRLIINPDDLAIARIVPNVAQAVYLTSTLLDQPRTASAARG